MLLMTCTQCWQTLRSSRSAGCGAAQGGQTAWLPWRGGLRQEFSIPSPQRRHGAVRARASHRILCWENGVFYPIPVRILPWVRHVLSSSDFWAQAELSVSSVWAEEPAASANSSGKERGVGCGHPAWLLSSCCGAWNVIIITLLLSYLPWVLCLPPQPLGWGITAYKIPLAALESSWSVWLDGLSW